MNARLLLPAAGGLLGWAAAFVLIYGLHGLGCAAGWDKVDLGSASLQRAVLVLSWTGCVLVSALWVLRARRRRTGHRHHAGADGASGLLLRLAEASAWMGLVATVVSLLPVATHSLCL